MNLQSLAKNGLYGLQNYLTNPLGLSNKTILERTANNTIAAVRGLAVAFFAFKAASDVISSEVLNSFTRDLTHYAQEHSEELNGLQNALILGALTAEAGIFTFVALKALGNAVFTKKPAAPKTELAVQLPDLTQQPSAAS